MKKPLQELDYSLMISLHLICHYMYTPSMLAMYVPEHLPTLSMHLGRAIAPPLIWGWVDQQTLHSHLEIHTQLYTNFRDGSQLYSNLMP